MWNYFYIVCIKMDRYRIFPCRVKRQLSSSLLRHREVAGGYHLGSEELHHQQGDPQGDEKCRLM